jgi:hypothetical protein
MCAAIIPHRVISWCKNGIDKTACVASTLTTVTKRTLVIIFASISGVTLLLRLATRLIGSRQMRGGWDDAVVTLAWLCFLPVPVLSPWLIRDGLGKDIWFVDLSLLSQLIRLLYITSVSFYLAGGLVKIAILAFYLRVFPSLLFKRVAWALVVFIVVWTIAFTLAYLFQCHPIDLAWNQWNSQIRGKCINYTAFFASHSAIGLALELAIFLLPMPVLFKLQLHWKKKLQVR